MEIWKAIEGYEGRYEVSDHGRVRSLITNKVLTLKKHNRGYRHVVLSDGEKERSFLVHRLVASAFVPTEDKSLTVNHIDENHTNNHAWNLEWCTMHENIEKYHANNRERKVREGIWGRKETNPIQQIDKNGNVLATWRSAVEIKKTLGFHDWSVKECCRGNRKSAYGYKWQFVI